MLCSHEEIRQYLEDVASHFQVFPNIKFNKTVVQAEWDDSSKLWTVSTDDDEQFQANFVFSACGELHLPHIPEFKGITILYFNLSTMYLQHTL